MMKRSVVSLLLALALLCSAAFPAAAAWQGSPSAGVKTEPGNDEHSGAGTANGGTTVGIVSVKGGVLLDPDDPTAGTDYYVVVSVVDENGDPIESATTQIVAINKERDKSATASATTNDAGQAVLGAFADKGYYFYGYKPGYMMVEPTVTDGVPVLLIVNKNKPEVTLKLQKYMQNVDDDQFADPVTVKVSDVKGQSDTVSAALVSVTFHVDGKDVTLDFITDENGEFQLTLPKSVSSWNWTVRKTDKEGVVSKKNTGVCQAGADSYELFFSAPSGGGGGTKKDPIAECAHDSSCPLYRFKDLDMSAWYHDGVHYCLEEGLFIGVSKDRFSPNTPVSRAQMAMILWRMEGKPAPKTSVSFRDVKLLSWYYTAVRWADESGLMGGYSRERFGPNDVITREQMATVLWRYAKYKGYDVGIGGNLGTFRDWKTASNYALTPLTWAYKTGLIAGVEESTLLPRGMATRAQVCTVLWRFLTAYER